MPDNSKPAGKDPERAAYERLAESASREIRNTQDVSPETISGSIDRAADALETAHEFTSGQIAAARVALLVDLGALAQNVERGAEFLQRMFDPGRVTSGFLSVAGALLEDASEALDSWKDRIERPLLRTTGEITGPGTLTCTGCGEEIEMEDAGRVPPCWKCHGTEFHKGY